MVKQSSLHDVEFVRPTLPSDIVEFLALFGKQMAMDFLDVVLTLLPKMLMRAARQPACPSLTL